MAAVRYLEDDDYEIGFSREQLAARMSDFEAGWGTGETFDLLFPSRAGDERLRMWYAKFQRLISSPGAIQRYQEAAALADARALLSSIAVPTMVMHPRGNAFVPLPLARYIAEHIDGATFLELPSVDVAPFWEHPEVALEAIERFVVGTQRAHAPERQLATVLFTDIVDSTGMAEAFGDRRWARSRTGSPELVHRTSRGCRGIHTGEVELRGDDVGGIAVHLASRIMSVAEPGETLVSNTVKDLVIGSDLAFEDRGVNLLRGIEGRWQLYAVVDRP